MIKLGVNTVLFGKFDLRTALQHLKWAGYDAAEISAIKGMCEHLCLDTWKKDAADIKALVQDLQMPLTAMEEAGLDEDRLMMAYEAGAEIGIPVVNVGPGGSKDVPEDLPKSIDTLARMAEKAEPFGVTLCVKAHVGAAIWNTPTTLEAMAKITSPAFGIDMDPSHIHRAGEIPKEALKAVVGRVKHIHIRDCLGAGPSPGTPELQACGRGEIDLMGYCKVLVDAGYDGPVNLEVIGAGEYELSRCAIVAAESYGYLNACLKACGGRYEQSEKEKSMAKPTSKFPNIVMFAIDSIRRDHMSCYGYPRLTTPYMDQIAKRGTLVENSFSAYIPTTPAYSSILTGRDVFSTRMVSLGPKGPLDPKQPTMGEILKKAGYVSTCVGFDGGFYRGFDQYLTFEGWPSWEDRPARKAENLNAVAIPALEKMNKSGKPFCLFLRHMDPHAPYLPPPPYDQMFYSKDPCDKRVKTMAPVFAFKPFGDFHASWMPPGCTDKDYVIAQYDGEVAYMDACIQRILTRLEELGVMEETLIVITGDHGETLYDHEIYFDHHGLYDPTLVVPLIFHWPGKIKEGVRCKAYTLHQDLLPTVLEICGLEKFAKGVKFDGVSTVPYLTNTADSPRSEFYITECTWMRKHGWRTPIWKFFEALEPDFHHKPKVELYNLVEDPTEYNNLAAARPDIVKYLRAQMNAWIEKRCKETGKPNPILEYKIGMDKYIGSIASAKKLQAR